MRFVTLFLNAMRISSRLDCRRFAVDPGYQRARARDLCAEVAPPRVARAATENAADPAWRTA